MNVAFRETVHMTTNTLLAIETRKPFLEGATL
jgi:hypothetical protein